MLDCSIISRAWLDSTEAGAVCACCRALARNRYRWFGRYDTCY